MKNIICLFLALFILISTEPVLAVEGQPDLQLNAKSAVLMEASTGEVLYEQDPDEALPIASVTKVMTMLLIMEALDAGKFTLEDMVPVSERAMSMGGSTMFLETGEQLSVHEMLKGIAVASANDGCVAMAEYIAGSEAVFVEQMNSRAQELGMKNTHFVNTNGLDDDNHYSSARDVAIMSRELIKHEQIFNYTTIWTDSLRDGKFSLANTNKLVRFYEGANGLKTGSTSKALCCLSATAKRNDMQLVGVVLGAPTSKERFASARTLLDYGFASYGISRQATEGEVLQEIPVKKGVKDSVNAVVKDNYDVLTKKGTDEGIEKTVDVQEYISAPVSAGEKIGTVTIMKNGQVIGAVDVVAQDAVARKSFGAVFGGLLRQMYCGIEKAAS